MRKNILKFAYALAFLFVAALPARTSAQFINAGFETGNFNGWTTNATATASTGFNQQSWLVSPANTFMARIEPGSLTKTTTETFLGLGGNALSLFNSDVFTNSTNFGGIKQTIFATAGQTITAYWNYVSQDYSPYNDGVIATLVGPGGYQQIKVLAMTDNAYGAPGAIVTGSYGSTGWNIVSFTAGAAGSYTLGFATFNSRDQGVNPILFLDDAAGGTTAPGQPTVTTTGASGITTTGALTGGDVTNTGGATVTARGVVYSTTPLPTLSNGFTIDGGGPGAFTSTLSNLSSGTTYYARAYATNSAGTSYGNEIIFSTLSLCTPTAFTNCPGNVTANAITGLCGAPVTYTTTASNNPAYTYVLNGATSGSGNGNASGTIFNVGTTYVQVNATNGCGTDNCYFTVTVTDNQAPIITNALPVISGECSATVTTVPTITDACAGTITGTTTDPLTYTPQGTYTITWNFNDGNGNNSTQTQTVIVNDITAPVADNATLPTITGECSATVTAAPTATDACAGTITGTTTDPLTYTTQGTHTITWTYNDGNGNTSTQTQSVIIKDVTAPTIAAPADVIVNGYCQAAPAILGTPVTGDNCVVASVTNDAPALFPIGNTTVTWTVTDIAGNTNTATQLVTVNPGVLSISGTVSDVLCNGGNTGAVNITVGNGTDPYAYSWSNGATTEDISNLAIGNYNVTVTDAHNCTVSSSYTVNQPTQLNGSVSVNPNPTVNGQQANTIFLGYGAQSVTLNATATGGAAGYTYSWTPGSGSGSSFTVSPTTTTTYTVKITDANGCTKTVTQKVTVKDIRDGNKKVFICHNGNTLSVSVNAVPAHLDHGDILGACVSTARKTAPEENTGDVLVAEELHLNVYPNPSTGEFAVELPALGNTQVMITDVSGKVILKQSISDNHEQVLKYNLNAEAKGLYFIKLSIDGNHYQSKVTLH